MLKVTHIVGQSVNLETGEESQGSIIISDGARSVQVPIGVGELEQLVGLWAGTIAARNAPQGPAKPTSAPPRNGSNGHAELNAPRFTPSMAPEEPATEVGEQYNDFLTGFGSV